MTDALIDSFGTLLAWLALFLVLVALGLLVLGSIGHWLLVREEQARDDEPPKWGNHS